jgi:hypothetical protein
MIPNLDLRTPFLVPHAKAEEAQSLKEVEPISEQLWQSEELEEVANQCQLINNCYTKQDMGKNHWK